MDLYDELLNDMAFIRLSTPIQFNQFVKPVKVFVGRLDPGTELVSPGWGFTEREEISVDLKFTNMVLYPNQMCDSYGHLIAKIMLWKNFCAGNDPSGPCSGDSGGPVVLRRNKSDFNSDVLVGAVSGAMGMICGSEPTLYLNLSIFADWLKERIPGIQFVYNLSDVS